MPYNVVWVTISAIFCSIHTIIKQVFILSKNSKNTYYKIANLPGKARLLTGGDKKIGKFLGQKEL